MNFEKEEAWVMARRNKHHGLEPLKKACAAIHNPQDQIRIIHVAGTNGKGSVSKALHDILRTHGFHVGLFTSPHLMNHRDRIRIDDAWISGEEFHYYLQKFMSLIIDNDLGMFEIDCLIAFAWFCDQKVDYAVIECGLGGRLDSTNIIQAPVLSVITTISMDHMNVLGNRIEQIAFEKAGILHTGLPAVCGVFSPAAEKTVHLHAVRLHVPLHHRKKYRSIGTRTFVYENDIYKMSTDAQYQKDNLSLALEAVRTLGINIHDEKTHEAIASTLWPGRFECVSSHPCIILDGAHNEEGCLALNASLRFLHRPLTIVFSALKDKPGRKMAQQYMKTADQLIITQFDFARADNVSDLRVDGALIEPDWQKAVQKAVDGNQNGTVLITGSLYFISLVRTMLAGQKK